MVVTTVSNPGGDVLHWMYLDLEGEQILVNNRIVRETGQVLCSRGLCSSVRQSRYIATTQRIEGTKSTC